MQPLAEVAGWLFGWLLRNSAHAAILAAAVWGLERLIGPRLPPRWRYGLWLVVVVRLLLPVAPESHFSLFNLVDLAPASLAGAALQVLGLPAPALPVVEPTDPLADTPAWFVCALAFWFSGALTLAGVAWRNHQRLKHALTATSPILDAEVLDLLRQSKAVMCVKQRVVVVESSEIRSPAVTGILRPRLLLPNDLLARLTPDEIRFLFLHELAHVKRADLIFNWAIALLQILHWFNPLIWLALRRLLTVREEVCDDLVLRRCFPGAAREYGLTLLRLLEECAPRRLFPAFASALDDMQALRQRIRCIRDFGIRSHHPCLPAVLTVAVAIVGLTERIGEPLFWRTGGGLAAVEPSELVEEVAPDPGEPEDTSLEFGGGSNAEGGREKVSQIVGVLTAALQQAATDLRVQDASDSAQRWVRESFGESARSSEPSSLATGPATANRTSVVVRPATRPYPLPPVSERGDIIRPRRLVTDSPTVDSGTRAVPRPDSRGRNGTQFPNSGK